MCKAVHVFDCVSCAPVESKLTIGFLKDEKDMIPSSPGLPLSRLAEQGHQVVRKGDTGEDTCQCGLRHALRTGCFHCLGTETQC
jgi:hypothetical protein